MISLNKPEVAVSISLLLCTYPVQVPISDQFIQKFANGSLPELDFTYPTGWIGGGGESSRLHSGTGHGGRLDPLPLRDASATLKAFPIKTSHPGATNKVNIFLNELGGALCNNDNLFYDIACGIAPYLAGRLFNDQATAWLMQAKALEKVLGGLRALLLSARLLLNPKEAKILGQCIKALGANVNHLGSMLVECETLQGRGVNPGDLTAEARYRVSASEVAPGLAEFDIGKLRLMVSTIIKEELSGMPVFESLDDHWAGRWGWCVNGSHARLLERCRPQYAVREIPGFDQYYRRMFAEAMDEEPVGGWDGHVFVTASPKLEHGKTRSIFACDSVSYFAFEHLLSPCEKLWRGRRVILDPGSRGHAGMVEKVLQLRSRGSVSVMLDFDDFNSQHSLEAQQAVIAALVEHSGYPRDLGSRLVDSFTKMAIYDKGSYVGTAAGTLMSGHRGTTFINSVLNAAYIRLSVGEETYSKCWSMHVGDDVYMSAPTYEAAASVLGSMEASPCRLNPTKQSVGSVSAEFLRTCSNEHLSRGYVARAISSAVSGNWVSDLKLDAIGGLNTMVQNSRTLYNRSGGVDFSRVLAPSCARMCGSSTAHLIPLLDGSIAVGSGPQFRSGGYYRSFDIDPEREEAVEFNKLNGVPACATASYLGRKTTDLEKVAIWEMGYGVRRAMIRSSYNKALSGGKQHTPQLRGHHARVMVPAGSMDVVQALGRPPRLGVLSSHPLLQLMKGSIKRSDLRRLVTLGGGNGLAGDIDAEAWGGEAHGIVARGFISYSDASAAAQRSGVGVVYSVRHFFL